MADRGRKAYPVSSHLLDEVSVCGVPRSSTILDGERKTGHGSPLTDVGWSAATIRGPIPAIAHLVSLV